MLVTFRDTKDGMVFAEEVVEPLPALWSVQFDLWRGKKYRAGYVPVGELTPENVLEIQRVVDVFRIQEWVDVASGLRMFEYVR